MLSAKRGSRPFASSTDDLESLPFLDSPSKDKGKDSPVNVGTSPHNAAWGLAPRAGPSGPSTNTSPSSVPPLLPAIPALATEQSRVASRRMMLKPVAYALMNVGSATTLILLNKTVFSVYGFHYTYALTAIHTLATMGSMFLFAALGMFQPKSLPTLQLLPLAAAYVGYIVLNNLSLKINTVGFFQVSKICIIPCVLAFEVILFGSRPTKWVLMAVAIVCTGVGLATVTDPVAISSKEGVLIGASAVIVTSCYSIWAGSKQKQLGAGSLQLLHQYSPIAAIMLIIMVPIFEPMGWTAAYGGAPVAVSDTLLGYQYTAGAVVAIALSAVLGLLVSISTFLLIGATSALTYNVCGHIKTVIILAGGVFIFGDAMPPQKLAGISLAMSGIIWYSHLKLAAAPAKPAGAAAKLEA